MVFTVNMGIDGKWYPINENVVLRNIDYYSGLLYPEYRFNDKETALIGANCCNEAYDAGYLQAQKDIKRALG